MSSPAVAAPLVTARLQLPVVTADLATGLLAGRGDALPEGLLAATGWPTADTLDGLRTEFGHAADVPPDHTGAGTRLVVRRDTAEVIGELGWKGGPDGDGTAEIGYGLAAGQRRRGYGTEAVGAFADWALDAGGAAVLVAEVVADNVPSRRLLERLGFRLDRVESTVVWYRRDR